MNYTTKDTYRTIIFMAFLPSALTSLTMCSLYLWVRFSELNHDLGAKAQTMAQTSETLTAFALKTRQLQNIQSLMSQTLEDKETRSISLLDANGREILHAGPKMLPIPEGKPLPSIPRLFTSNDSIRAVTPIYGQTLDSEDSPADSRELSGWIQIELTYDHIRLEKYQTALITLIILAITLALSFALYVRLGLSVNSSIKKIIEVLQTTSSTDYSQRLPAKPGSLLYFLERQINLLLDRESRSRQELQGSVEQSTSELQETLKTLEIQSVELDLARKEAIQASNSKSEFLANMSHEIRTPLNGISGYTTLLLESDLKHYQREYLTTIEKSAQGLMTMLNDILDFSRIEAGKLELDYQTFSLREVIDDALAIMAPAAHQKSLELVSFIYEETPEEIIGDRQRLGQILTNLTNNAVKFTQLGHVAVRAMLDHKDDDGLKTIKFAVTDTGSGLTPEQQSQIFKAFIQADSSRTRQAGGTGLGLAISKTLVEEMQGEIGLESEPGKGSTFWFTIRVRVPRQVTAPEQRVFNCKSIVLYEQQELSRLSIGHQLESLNLNVTSFGTLSKLNHYMSNSPSCDLLLFGQGSEPLRETIQQAQLHNRACPTLLLTLTGNCDDFPCQLPDNIKTISKPVCRIKLKHCLEALVCTEECCEEEPAQHKVIHQLLNILVVDDHPANLKLLQTILTGLNQHVVTANSGFDAIEFCQQQHFDLILMDMQMPGLDGLETTAKIRTLSKHYQDIPVIAITAHALPDERRQILQSGINDYMTKPVYTRELLNTINRWTEKNSTSTTSTENQPIDVTESRKLTTDNKALASELLGILLEGLPDDLDIISTSFQKNDREALLERVHRLHGACQYCAVPDLKAACFELESRLKKTEALTDQTIIQAVEKTTVAIKKLLASQQATNSPEPQKPQHNLLHQTD